MRIRIVLLVLLLPLPAMAQWPPTSTRNLKVLPPDMPIAALVDTMASFTRALGVRCTYCHVGREGDPLDQYDFASDARQAKQTARDMLRMAQEAGFTLEEVRTLLTGYPDATPAGERWADLARRKIPEVDALIARLQAVRATLEESLRCGCPTLDACAAIGWGGRGGQS